MVTLASNGAVSVPVPAVSVFESVAVVASVPAACAAVTGNRPQTNIAEKRTERIARDLAVSVISAPLTSSVARMHFSLFNYAS